VAGCMEGDCHFLKGNFRAKKRVAWAKKILEEVGIGGDRLEMYNMSAAMGPRFAEVAREMTDKIRKLGPSPAKKAESIAQSAKREKQGTAERKENDRPAQSAERAAHGA